MPWDASFDEPIRLPSGKLLSTLRDAGQYVSSLPATEQKQPKWQSATQALLIGSEGGPTMLARIAMMQAILPAVEPKPDPKRKNAWPKKEQEMTDQQLIVRAIWEAQLILATYVEPGARDPDKTINELLSILDRNDVVEAVDRLEVECGLRSL